MSRPNTFHRDSYDWREVFKYGSSVGGVPGYTGSLDPFTIDDVDQSLCSVDGENDGACWIGVFLLKDGRFVCIRAGCDYTGWG